MRRANFSRFVKNILPVIALMIFPVAIPAIAQEQGSSSTTTQTQQAQPSRQSSADTQRSASRETVTTTSQTNPVTQTTGIDPLWLAIGGVAVLALIVIAILAARGRSTDTVHEHRTTVIKE
jgi:bacteriorhodopsin